LAEYQAEAFPVAGALRIRATIDYTRNDNGFLRCVYDHYRAAANMTVLSHASTLGARNNLSFGTEGWSIIVGHGAPGLIVTGTGQVVDGIQRYIGTDVANLRYWYPILSRGVIGGGLTLFGCEVGAGDAGTRLLRWVANAIRKPVGAWTGLVWCGSTVWAEGSFKVVRPGAIVAVEEPVAMYAEASEPLQLMRLAANDEDFEEVSPERITAAEFTPVGSYAGQAGIRAVRAEKADALSILQRVDFENPFVTEDKPGSIVVGTLNVAYGGAKGKAEGTRMFRVLGSSLVQDVTYPNTYYYAALELPGLLR
jgi:hypothetical protein